MPIKEYGVWTARAVRVSAETAQDDPDTPHIHLFYDDGQGGPFDGARRASINIRSKSAISELVYWFEPDFRHPIVDRLASLEPGFQGIVSRAGSLALDYLRDNLVDFGAGRLLPHDIPGPDNDLIDAVMPELQCAVARGATVHLFGEPYLPSRDGIHDIHMNQGSVGQFRKYNGVWQDGAVFLRYPNSGRTAAMFFAFGSQAIHTDEATGHALQGSRILADLYGRPRPGPEHDVAPLPARPIRDDRRVAIVAALVNPSGPDNQPGFVGQPETVYLINTSDEGFSLGGWSILNRADEAHVLAVDTWLQPRETRAITCPGAVLSNRGGTITLLDSEGNKVDGVTYTEAEARAEGRLVVFR